MSSSTRPPADLEIKGAAPMLAPRPTAPTPDTGSVAPEGIVELIAAVTGVRDDVADIIRPGAPGILAGWIFIWTTRAVPGSPARSPAVGGIGARCMTQTS